MALFELLKYFPGPLEPMATFVIPGVVVAFLLLLPFLDHGETRHSLRGSRRTLTAVMMAIVAGTSVLTVLGLRDTPARYEPNDWGPHSVAGHLIVAAETSPCARCHVDGGPAADLSVTRSTRDEEWLMVHMADPVVLAPGVRLADDPAPSPMLGSFQSQAVVAYLRRIRAGADPPKLTPHEQLALTTFASTCVACHRIAGEGGQRGPDLSRVGTRRDAASIKRVILDPTSEFPDTAMPKYGTRLKPDQIDALAEYLSNRQE